MTDPDELARACAHAMWEKDGASQQMGMVIDEIKRGYARQSMTISESMINGHKIAHGGCIFTLADSTFAFACNTYNQLAVAQHCSISYVAPSHLGDRLTAVAEERHRQGRNAIYDITVTNQDGETVAEFRGNSRTIKGQHVTV